MPPLPPMPRPSVFSIKTVGRSYVIHAGGRGIAQNFYRHAEKVFIIELRIRLHSFHSMT
jgi:hypothetical protein